MRTSLLWTTFLFLGSGSLTPGVWACGPYGYRVHSSVASLVVSSKTTVKEEQQMIIRKIEEFEHTIRDSTTSKLLVNKFEKPLREFKSKTTTK